MEPSTPPPPPSNTTTYIFSFIFSRLHWPNQYWSGNVSWTPKTSCKICQSLRIPWSHSILSISDKSKTRNLFFWLSNWFAIHWYFCAQAVLSLTIEYPNVFVEYLLPLRYTKREQGVAILSFYPLLKQSLSCWIWFVTIEQHNRCKHGHFQLCEPSETTIVIDVFLGACCDKVEWKSKKLVLLSMQIVFGACLYIELVREQKRRGKKKQRSKLMMYNVPNTKYSDC